ncbi:MAG: hypothetical protein MZV49_16815 [Rhodopseudomonas palustris]|nr:hypothetical protein [Rhodopseudomonas palustris]
MLVENPRDLREIRTRVYHALQRHPLCRHVKFDVMQTPRSRRGVNWTVNIRAVEPRALWEASEIVADIQDAYELAAAV